MRGPPVRGRIVLEYPSLERRALAAQVARRDERLRSAASRDRFRRRERDVRNYELGRWKLITENVGDASIDDDRVRVRVRPCRLDREGIVVERDDRGESELGSGDSDDPRATAEVEDSDADEAKQ